MLSTHIKFIIETINRLLRKIVMRTIIYLINRTKKFLGSIILPKINIKADLTTNQNKININLHLQEIKTNNNNPIIIY